MGEDSRSPTCTRILMGITKASGQFLIPRMSAASFQETTKVLTEAAIMGSGPPPGSEGERHHRVDPRRLRPGPVPEGGRHRRRGQSGGPVPCRRAPPDEEDEGEPPDMSAGTRTTPEPELELGDMVLEPALTNRSRRPACKRLPEPRSKNGPPGQKPWGRFCVLLVTDLDGAHRTALGGLLTRGPHWGRTGPGAAATPSSVMVKISGTG